MNDVIVDPHAPIEAIVLDEPKKPRQNNQQNNNLSRVENIVNAIFEDVARTKNSTSYNVDAPNAEIVLAAINRGKENVKKLFAEKNRIKDAPQNVVKISKTYSRLTAALDTIELSDSEEKVLMNALLHSSKDLSSHIAIIKRRSVVEKPTKFSF